MGACTTDLGVWCSNDHRNFEYEFADTNLAINCRLSITNKESNNDALVKHIRSVVTAGNSVNPSSDIKDRLREAIGKASILKLKMTNGNIT